MSQNRKAEGERLLPVAEALGRITEGVAPLEAETIPLDQAAGRTLAEALAARLTQPPFPASAMDGYAVRIADLTQLPAFLKVIGVSAAGHAFSGAIRQREAVRIFTGAPVPEGADHIVIQENIATNGDSIVVNDGSDRNAFIRRRGLDFSEGQVLLEAGRMLGARELALAAAMNHTEVPVRRRPEVAILATGDELVAPGEEARPDQIISSIPFGLAALVDAAGGQAIRLGIARDTLESLAEQMERADHADVLVTIGGASVGDHDLVRQAWANAGIERIFGKIAMRPGKPLMFGRKGRLRALGLPGNPVSALICARVFLIPLLAALIGRTAERDSLTATLEHDLEENGPRQHYMRGQMSVSPAGDTTVRCFPDQDSSLMATLAAADCLVVRDPHAPRASKGERVRVLPLKI